MTHEELKKSMLSKLGDIDSTITQQEIMEWIRFNIIKLIPKNKQQCNLFRNKKDATYHKNNDCLLSKHIGNVGLSTMIDSDFNVFYGYTVTI